MQYISLTSANKDPIRDLFTETFTHSEGKEEGELIGNLAKQLTQTIDNQTAFCFAAIDNQKIQGVIFFSQLKYPNCEPQVFMLAPVAVRPDNQRKGIGQALISFGLKRLSRQNIDIVITYGDPKFYSKVGFSPISEKTLPAPFPLSMPEGWLAQSLKADSTITPIETKPTCAIPFQNPIYW